MRIALAQFRPKPGQIEANLQEHLEVCRRAASEGAELVAFPELSLTGYEPQLAQQLAVESSDPRLDAFQHLSDEKTLSILVGVPTVAPDKPHISALIFRPGEARQVYSKAFIHSDEEPFFTAGPPDAGIICDQPRVAIAICYEISVPQHAEQAHWNGAEIYLASVAKPADGVETALGRMKDVARQFSIPTLMVNSVGPSDTWQSAGKSSAWNAEGELLGQLDEASEGLLMVGV